VRRILVAQSVGLWIRLNRHLSGVSAVDLVETPTLETGRLLARLERPAIVVFSGEAGRPEAEDLVADLDERASKGTRVVLVSEDLAPTARPLQADGPALVVCPPDDLVHVVTELLALGEEPKRALDLLVHYQADAGSTPGEGFVIVLDLDEQQLVLQGDHAFEIGTELSLHFFLPGPVPEGPRDKVSLTCRVESCRNEVDLIYGAAVSGIDASAARAVQRFLAGAGS
jgi:hypothetical protein